MIQPASSSATVMRWTVRVPPKASRYAPGFATRRAAVAHSACHRCIRTMLLGGPAGYSVTH